MGCVQSYFRKAHSAGLSPSSTQGSDKPPLIGNSTDEDALLDKDLVIVDANEVKLAQQQDGDAEKKPEAERNKSAASDGAAKPVAAEKAAETKTNAAPAGAKSPPKTAVRPEDVITAAPAPTPMPAPVAEKDGEGGPRHARRPSSSTSNVSLSGTTTPSIQPIASFPETPEPAKADKIAPNQAPEFPAKATTSPTSVAAEVKQERPASSEKSTPGSPVTTSVEVKQEAKPASPTTPPEVKEATKIESVTGEQKPTSPVSDKGASTVQVEAKQEAELPQSPAAKSPEPTAEVVSESPAMKTEEKSEPTTTEEKAASLKSVTPSSDATETTVVSPEVPEVAEKEAAAAPAVPAPEEPVPEPLDADVRPVERPSAMPDIPSPSPETGELPTSAVTPTTVLITPSADGPASPTAGSPETGEIPTPTVSITVSPAPDRTPTSSDDEEPIVIPSRQQVRNEPAESSTASADQEAPSAAAHDSAKQATDEESVDEVVPSSPNRAHSEATTASMGESRQDSRADTPHSVLATAGSELEDSTVDEEVLGAAAAKIQAGFRGYKTRRELKNGSTSESQEEKRSEQPKDESKTSEAPEEPAVLEAAATKIQATIRGHQTRQKLKEEGVITTKDDTVVVDASADSDKETKPESPVGEKDTADLESAATKIQATFRGYKTRKEVLQEELKPASTDETGKEVSTDQVAKDQQSVAKEVNEAVLLESDPSALESAATTIQATFRGFKTRQELQKEGKTETSEENGKSKDVVQEKIDTEENKPVVKELEVKGETPKTETKEGNVEVKGTKPEIGGEKTEPEVEKDVKDAKVDDDPSVIESAAATIQAAFKGYQTRQQLKKEELIDAATDIADDAATTVVAKAEDAVRDAAESPVVESAATTIQAAFRGHQTRQQLKKKGDGDNKEESGERVEDKASTSQAPEESGATDDVALHAAAASIQATFRGYKTRQQLKNEGKGEAGDVTTEQPSIEQQLAEACQEAGADLEAAATTIQANFRGFQARKEFQQVKAANSETGEAAPQPPPQPAAQEGAAYHDRVLDAAATTIQATFRGYQTRQKVAKPGETAADAKQAVPQSEAAPEEACVPPLEDMVKTAPAASAAPLETAASLSRASTVEASVPPVEDAVAVVAAAPKEALEVVLPPEASVPPPEDALPPQPQPLSAQTSLAESLHEASVPPLEDLLEKAAPAQARQPASFSSHVSLADNVPDTDTADVPDSKPAANAAATEPAAGNSAESEKTTPQPPSSDAADEAETEPSREPGNSALSQEPDSRIGSEKDDAKAESTKVEPKPDETAAALAPQAPSGAVADSAGKTEASSSDGPAQEATAAKDSAKTVPTLVAQAEKEVSKLAMASVEASGAQSVAKEPEAEAKKEPSLAAESSEKSDAGPGQSSSDAGDKDAKKDEKGVKADGGEEPKGEAPVVSDRPEKVPGEANKASQETEKGSSENAQVESTPPLAAPVVKPPSPKEATAPASSEPAAEDALPPKPAEDVISRVVAEAGSSQEGAIGKDETGSVESLPEPPTAPLSPKERSSPPSEAGEPLSSDAALPSPPLSSQASLSESLPAAASAPPPLASAPAEDSPLTSTATPEPPSEDALPPPPPPGQGSSRSDSEATPVPEPETASVASASGAPAAEDSVASLPPPPPPQAAAGDSPPDSASVGAGAADGDSSLPPPPDNDNNSLTDVSMVTDTASEAGDAQIPRSPETGEQKKRPSQVEDLSALQRPQECAELPHQQRGAAPLENSPDDLAELEEEESVSSSSVDSAATKIQAGVRGFLTRRQVQRMRSTQTPSPAAGAMSAGAMGMSLDSAMPKAASAAAAAATRSADVLEEDGEVWDTLKKEMDDAASTIQSGFRGFQARQKLTRAEAVRAASSGSSGSGGGSLDQPTLSPGPGSGELHDSLVLPPPPPPPQEQQ